MSRVIASLALASPAWRRLRWTVAGSVVRTWASRLVISVRIRAGSASRSLMWSQTTLVEVVGAYRLVCAHPAVLVAVVIRAEAAVVVDDLGGGAGRGAVVGVAAAGADADSL